MRVRMDFIETVGPCSNYYNAHVTKLYLIAEYFSQATLSSLSAVDQGQHLPAELYQSFTKSSKITSIPFQNQQTIRTQMLGVEGDWGRDASEVGSELKERDGQFILIQLIFKDIGQDMQQSSLQIEKQQTGRWTKEEHQRFMYAIMQHGKDWKKVEQCVRTRSGSQVRSHAQKFFNKLQKVNQHSEQPHRTHQEFSETDFDIERELNNQASTPLELVSLIKKQSKEEGGRVNLEALRFKLEERNEQAKKQTLKEKNNMPESLAQQNSYKSMSNILSAYEGIHAQTNEKKEEDEGFLILLTKKYKGLFKKIDDFGNLIDLHNSPVVNHAQRKRSFTLPEGNDLSGEELDQKIEQIKKAINTEPEKKTKTPLIIQGEEKKEAKEGQRNNNEAGNGEEMPNLNRLATIQEQPKQDQEYNSYRALPQHEDEVKGDRTPRQH